MPRMMDKEDDRIYKYWWFIYLTVNTRRRRIAVLTLPASVWPWEQACMLVLSWLVQSCLTHNSAHCLTTELWHLSLSFKPWLWIYRQPQSTTDNEPHIRDCANQLSVTVTEHLRQSAYNERRGSQMWGFSSMVFWACSGSIHPGRMIEAAKTQTEKEGKPESQYPLTGTPLMT